MATYNYIKIDEAGVKYATSIAPVWGTTSTTADYYDYATKKWYDKDGVAYTSQITYLPYRVLVDEQGNVLDVDKFDIPTLVDEYIKADKVEGEMLGKNSCTAWVNFDGTTTPPTIRDSYNVSQVIRIATGAYNIYFETLMDNINYSATIASGDLGYGSDPYLRGHSINYCWVTIADHTADSVSNSNLININIFGGKNV